MKFTLYPKSSIDAIPRDTEEIHLTRPVNHKTAKKLLERCNGVRAITLSSSTLQRISGKTRKFLKGKNIEVTVKKSKGRPISLDLQEMLRVIELRKDFRSYGDIAEITGIPKSTAHYLIKYADRGKIRQGKQVIHLK